MSDATAKLKHLERALQIASDGVRIEDSDGSVLFDSMRFEARRTVADADIPQEGLEVSFPGDVVVRLETHDLDDGGRLVVARDISAVRRAEEELQRLSLTDSLTGSGNWRAAERRGIEAVETYRRYGRPFSVLRLDIVNLYSLEHREHREAVIKHVTRVAGHTLRVVDLLARIEDGRFVAVMPETDLAAAKEAGNRICERLSRSGLQHAGTEIDAEVCAGVTAYDDPEVDFEGLVGKAEAALEEAKALGSNQVVAAG